jgi:hypothetical protein
MEQVLLGIVVFNAFFMPSDFQFDTLEFSQIQLEQNKNSELNFGNELKSIQGMAIGSREYSQATSWLRYGHGTYLYGHKNETENGLRKLNHYGGYAGLLAEVHYKRYFGLGVLVGGGASYTEFTNSDLSEDDRSNYFGLASPYITLGLPITGTASVNLTASTFYLSEPAEQIDGAGEGFETPHNLENKIGLEFVWSWD